MRKTIKSITAVNLKGQTFTHELNKVTVFVGDNEAGKTARFDAILLAQLGYKLKPGQKPMRTPAAIFRSCGQRGGGATLLKVGNLMSDGQSIDRNWTIKRGKISYDGPDDSYIPQMMLDPSGFFAMTGPDRRNLVLQQVDLEALGIGCKPLMEKLHDAFTGDTLDDIKNDQKFFSAKEMVDKINQLEATRQTEQGNVYDWLTAVVDAITSLRDAEAHQADTHEQTLRGLTDNKAEDNDMTALQSVQPEINQRRQQHTEAVATEATALAAFSAAQRKVQETKAVVATMVDETAVQEAIKVQRQRIKSIVVTLGAPDKPPTPKQMTEARPIATTAQQEARRLSIIAQTAHQDQQMALREAKRLEAEIEQAKHKTSCPACGQSISHLQADVIKTLQKQLAHAQGVDVSKTSVAAIATGNANDAAARLAAIENAIATWDAEKAKLDGQNQGRLSAHNANVRDYNTAQATINNAQATIYKLESSIQANQTAKDAWVLLPELETASLDAGIAYTNAKNAIPPIAEAIRQMETQQRQFIARTQNERLANQSRAQLETANQRLAVFKAALKVVQGEKERAATDAFNALLKHARLMTDGNLRAPLEFRDSELGMAVDGNWVEIGEFSGKQQIFAMAGLGLALTQNNQGVRIVMVDEMGRLTSENKHRLIDRLLELIKHGVIDQAVLADVSGDDYLNYDLNADVELITIDSPVNNG